MTKLKSEVKIINGQMIINVDNQTKEYFDINFKSEVFKEELKKELITYNAIQRFSKYVNPVLRGLK